MTLRITRVLRGLALVSCVANPALSHQLSVFAATDCEDVLVEAKFSSGRAPVEGDVRILDGDNTLLQSLQLGQDGTLKVPLEGLDATKGLLIEVDAGGHDDYWILTPEDIAGKCQS